MLVQYMPWHINPGGQSWLPPGLFDDLVRCETRLYNALNDRLRERHGIVTSQFEFLHYLRERPGARGGSCRGVRHRDRGDQQRHRSPRSQGLGGSSAESDRPSVLKAGIDR